MKIIFTQGNPGIQYQKTRHNIGYIFADLLAEKWGVPFTPKSKFHADVAETSRSGEKILIVKPTTFYNDTGQSARKLIDFYKLDPTTDFLVIHDDLALPFGTIRTREQGRDAGNNGVKSLNAHIGEQHKRIRVGIYNPLRDRMHDADFVLGVFSQDEQTALPQLFKEVEYFVDMFIEDSFLLTKVNIRVTDQTPKSVTT
jgi:PTH1 family peptidyl-tRNA hydrolase